MINARTWARRGSEAQSADAAACHTGPIATDDLETVLVGHFEADLAGLSDEDRVSALAALVRGYLEGA